MYEPSLGAIAFGSPVVRRSRVPRFVGRGTFGVRPVIISGRQPMRRQAPAMNEYIGSKLLAPALRGKTRMQILNEFAVYAGGKRRPQIPNARIRMPFSRKQSRSGRNILGRQRTRKIGRKRNKIGRAHV